MPIYEYQCGSCENVFEELQRASDPDPDKCPECGASSVRRRISNTSFQLKGQGWYVTDYKSSTAPSSGASTNSSSSSAAPASTDSESSPAPDNAEAV